MTDKTFFEVWSDICTHYSSHSKENIRIFTLYSKEAKGVPDSCADKLFGTVLKECEKFPSLARFSDICQRYCERKPEKRFSDISCSCDYCRSSGIISVNKYVKELRNTYEFFYICPKCEKGKALKKPSFKYFTEVYSEQELESIKEQNQASSFATVDEAKKAFWESISKFGYKHKAALR